jgi:hypothetical protein
MADVARGTFEVEITPDPAEIGGSVKRSRLSKVFAGDLSGTSEGLMLSAGDPQSSFAGYVAVEKVTGSLAGREGEFVFQQFATMAAGQYRLEYEITPGSGTGELAGLTGRLALVIDEDGTHRYEIEYSFEGEGKPPLS